MVTTVDSRGRGVVPKLGVSVGFRGVELSLPYTHCQCHAALISLLRVYMIEHIALALHNTTYRRVLMKDYQDCSVLYCVMYSSGQSSLLRRCLLEGRGAHISCYMHFILNFLLYFMTLSDRKQSRSRAPIVIKNNANQLLRLIYSLIPS